MTLLCTEVEIPGQEDARSAFGQVAVIVLVPS